jgi:hypothetical protein
LADGELVQEVQSAFSLVVEDLLAGQYIEEGTGSDKGFFIVGRRNPLANDSQPGENKKESYWLHNMASLVKLTRGTIYAPLTGDHTLAQVTVVEFSLERDEVYPDVYKLRLTGKSEMTKHEYTLCTAVYLPRQKIRPTGIYVNGGHDPAGGDDFYGAGTPRFFTAGHRK